MNLTTLVTRVANRCNKNASDTTTKARLINHINDSCQENWDGYKWTFRKREYPFVLSPWVTSGTMTATNGSRTVTASGTPFDSTLHVGAFIRFTADNPATFYRITAVNSTSSVLIEPAYQGTTGAAKGYELKKCDYLFPSEVNDFTTLTLSAYGLTLAILEGLEAIDVEVGVPNRAYLFESDFKGSTYTTGTVTGTINTKTLTGIGTSWLANVTPGDTIVIGSDTNTYTVYSVDSDTAITLYNSLVVAAAAGSYTITRRYGRKLRILPVSSSLIYVLYLTGYRKYAPLVNDTDTNEMTERFSTAIVESSVRREMSSSPDGRESMTLQVEDEMWRRARAEDQVMTPRSNCSPMWNSRRYR